MPINTERVRLLIEQVAAEEILPRFQNLETCEITEKNAGELVTSADQAAERRLTDGLADILPGSIVVGEEAAHGDPTILDALKGSDPVWLVDPLDGTVNFANRKPPFGTMVALLHGGETKVAWIHNPLSKQTAVAEKGGGASINGTPCKTLAPAKQLVGVVLTGFVPTEYRSAVENAFDGFTTVPPTRCAVQHYLEMAEGHIHFSFYWRTRPWDHAPGVLLIEECGGKAARLDGTPYRPADKSKGLLVAADTTAWQAVQGKLPEDLRRPNPD